MVWSCHWDAIGMSVGCDCAVGVMSVLCSWDVIGMLL